MRKPISLLVYFILMMVFSFYFSCVFLRVFFQDYYLQKSDSSEILIQAEIIIKVLSSYSFWVTSLLFSILATSGVYLERKAKKQNLPTSKK